MTIDDAPAARIADLVRIDTERQTIDADTYLASLSPWYRPACAAIVRHWSRILALPVFRSRSEASWIRQIRRAVTRLTDPTTDVRQARGMLEWRHPEARLEDDPIGGLCWVGDASGGLGGTYLCWTPLTNLESLGGAHWTRELDTHVDAFTPQGGAAQDIFAYVRRQIALEDRP